MDILIDDEIVVSSGTVLMKESQKISFDFTKEYDLKFVFTMVKKDSNEGRVSIDTFVNKEENYLEIRLANFYLHRYVETTEPLNLANLPKNNSKLFFKARLSRISKEDKDLELSYTFTEKPNSSVHVGE